MKLLIFILLPLLSYANHELVALKSDANFSGHYLNIEKTMQYYNISRLKAHEIQNRMRDYLEHKTGSFSATVQKPVVQRALNQAVRDVIDNKFSEGFYKPIKFKHNEFVVVLDLDETLLSHWYSMGSSDTYGSFKTDVPDIVPSFVNRKTGESLDQAQLLISSSLVQNRPQLSYFLEKVSKLKGFKGFIIFTAKEDQSAWSIYDYWEKNEPELLENVVGFYTRNYLKFHGDLKKPSKDLRMFDESLQHVFLIDDNESRIVQKDLNYRIPKFNADHAIESSISQNTDMKLVNGKVLEYTYKKIKNCTQEFYVTNCLSRKLGELSQYPNEEIIQYIEWLNKTYGTSISVDEVLDHHVFEPAFNIKETIQTEDEFPLFEQGLMVLE